MAKKRRKRKTPSASGNFRTPVRKAGRRYWKSIKTRARNTGSAPTGRGAIRLREAQYLHRQLEAVEKELAALNAAPTKDNAQRRYALARILKTPFSKKKGRGNFKPVTKSKARAYLSRVYKSTTATQQARYPIAPHVKEAESYFSKEELDELKARGKAAKVRADARAAAAAEKKRKAAKTRLASKVKKLKASLDRLVKGADKSKKNRAEVRKKLREAEAALAAAARKRKARRARRAKKSRAKKSRARRAKKSRAKKRIRRRRK